MAQAQLNPNAPRFRAAWSYRAGRRNLARKHKLVWRGLKRATPKGGPVIVLLPAEVFKAEGITR